MPTQDEIMTKYVPSLGVIIGTLMFLSPLKAVLDMRRNGRIGVRVYSVLNILFSSQIGMSSTEACYGLFATSLRTAPYQQTLLSGLICRT